MESQGSLFAGGLGVGGGALLLRGGLPVTLTQDNVERASQSVDRSVVTEGGLAFWSLHLPQSQGSHLYSCDLN